MRVTVLVSSGVLALLAATGLLAADGHAAPLRLGARTCWHPRGPSWTPAKSPRGTYTTSPNPGTKAPTSTATPPSTTMTGYVPGTPRGASGRPTVPGVSSSGGNRPTGAPSGPRKPGIDWHTWWGTHRMEFWPVRTRTPAAPSGTPVAAAGVAAGPWVMRLERLAESGQWTERAAMADGIAWLHTPLLAGLSIRLMQDSHGQVARQGVFAAAASLPTSASALIALRQVLENPTATAHQRGAAAMAIGALRDPAARDLLQRMYHDARDPMLRIGAGIGLGLLGSDGAVAALARVLADRKAPVPVRSGAAVALGALARNPRQLTAAGAALLGTVTRAGALPVEVRQSVAINLGNAASVPAVHARLTELVQHDGDARTRAMAALALGRLARRDPEARAAARHALTAEFAGEPVAVQGYLVLALGLGRISDETARVRAWLHTAGSSHHRAAGAVALALMGQRAAAGAVIRAIQDGPPQYRGDAAEALGYLGGPEALGELRRLLADPRVPTAVRAAAAYGLGVGGSAADRSALEALLAERSAQARTGAVLGLAALGGTASRDRLLAHAASEHTPAVRALAVNGALAAVAGRPLRGPAKHLDRSPWAREH